MDAVRRVARLGHLYFTGLFMLGVVAQFFLAGLGIFGGGVDFEPHEVVGLFLHLLSALILLFALIAWLPGRDILFSFAITALTTIQMMLPAAGSEWVQALHPLNALVLLGLGDAVMRRARARLKNPAVAPLGAPGAYGETASGKPPAR